MLALGRIDGTLQEREAICAIKAGDIAALEVLYELHNRAVFRTAYGIVRSYDLAEDVTQQVFIEVFTSIKRYNDRRPFRPWLHRIAINLSIDAVKRDRRNVPFEDAGELESPSISPQDAAELSEKQAAVRKAIWSLSPKQRAVVVLYYYHGFRGAEMAEALCCRLGTVRSRLHYAMLRLREILGGDAPPYPEEGQP